MGIIRIFPAWVSILLGTALENPASAANYHVSREHGRQGIDPHLLGMVQHLYNQGGLGRPAPLH